MIIPPLKVILKKSPIHGLGVFATEPIYEGEIIEICPVIDMELNMNENSSIMNRYRFNWPQGSSKPEKQVLPVGYGMIYNHSETPNASWRSNFDNNSFEFYAIKNIKTDEEIFTWYGDVSYWNNIKNINLK
jgi:SET domain-containing protein